jgi:DNA-binding transcriptional MerR regulator
MTPSPGWLTLHEVLEATGLPYRQLMDLAERGLLATRRSGAVVLYDPDDVTLVALAKHEDSVRFVLPMLDADGG